MRHEARQVPSWLIFDVGQNLRVMNQEGAFPPDLHLLRSAAAEVLRRLRTARHQDDLFAVISWAAKEMNRTFANEASPQTTAGVSWNEL